MSGSGDMDMAAKPLKASLRLASSSLGGDITMLVVDNAMYMKSKVFGAKYMKVSTGDKNSPLAQMGLDSLDPTAMFDRFDDAFLNEAQAFVAAVRARDEAAAGRGDAPPAQDGATLADALEATRIGCALRASLQAGQAVTL